MSTMEVKVPDIGDFKDVPVIEIFVKPGDTVKAEDSLVSLESDKATMDVPAPMAGVIKDLKIKLGDKVSEGSVLLMLDTNGAGDAKAAPAKAAAAPVQTPTAGAAPAPAQAAALKAAQPESKTTPAAGGGEVVDIKVPDIGDFADIPVIEIFVKPGDTVKLEDPLVSLESDKATMDVPASAAGVVKEIRVKLGDEVSEGSVILTLQSSSAAGSAPAAPASAPKQATQPNAAAATAAVDAEGFKKAHASPSVRAFARELGVDLSRVKGSGAKDRILQEDVQAFVKQAMSAPVSGVAAATSTGGGAGLDLLPWPKVDFAKFGAVEAKPLSRIKKISGANLHRNWVMIPHVTNNDDADITELEAFRVQLNKENEKSGTRVTMLVFIIKACIAALKKFPDFNTSLDGDNLIYKQYYNIGFAADTPNGLVVPVIKNADQKGMLALAKEMTELSLKAREGKLGPADMQGGCFSISSLGGIGGSYFTPIINAPEVAILGVGRSSTQPVWDGKQFAPKLMLPLSLSYDHRVIDGASAARFNSFLVALLGDMRRAML